MSWLLLSAEEVSALRLSVTVALWALLFSAVPGVFCGWWISGLTEAG